MAVRAVHHLRGLADIPVRKERNEIVVGDEHAWVVPTVVQIGQFDKSRIGSALRMAAAEGRDVRGCRIRRDDERTAFDGKAKREFDGFVVFCPFPDGFQRVAVDFLIQKRGLDIVVRRMEFHAADGRHDAAVRHGAERGLAVDGNGQVVQRTGFRRVVEGEAAVASVKCEDGVVLLLAETVFYIGSRRRRQDGLFFVGERDVPFGGVRQCFAREFVCAEKIEIGGVSGLDLIGGLEDDLRQFYGKNGVFREAAKRRAPPGRPRPETAVADCLKGKAPAVGVFDDETVLRLAAFESVDPYFKTVDFIVEHDVCGLEHGAAWRGIESELGGLSVPQAEIAACLKLDVPFDLPSVEAVALCGPDSWTMRTGQMAADDFDGLMLPFRLGGHGADGQRHGEDGDGEMIVVHGHGSWNERKL